MSSRGVIILGVVAAFLLFASAYLVDYLEKINYIEGYRTPLQAGLITGGVLTLVLCYLFARQDRDE